MDALLVVDMQAGLLNGAPKHDLAGVVGRINRLSRSIRGRGGRVIFIQHHGPQGDRFEPGSSGWALLPELDRASADLIVGKTLNYPFAGTDLAQRPPAPRRRHGHRSPSLGVERTHHPALHQACNRGPIAGVTRTS